jgi:hypothetical protein
MNEINVRIKHKYDKYANWLTSEIVLGEGELAIAEIPSPQTFEEPDGSTVLTPPAIGIKVGNGEKKFNELPWIQSTAGDVYAWAKEAEKPVYNAEEIEGLEEYIAGTSGGINTQYHFEYVNDTLYVWDYTSGESVPDEWNPENATWELPITVSTKVDKVEVVEGIEIEGNIVELTADGNIRNSERKLDEFLSKVEAERDYVSQTTYSDMEEYISDVNDRLVTAEGLVEGLKTSVDTLTGEGEGSVKKQVADAVASVVDNAPENLDTLKEIATVISGGTDGGAAGLIVRVDTLEDKIVSLETDTISPMLETIGEHKTNIEDLQGRTSDIEEILNNETTGLVKAVSDNTDEISTIKGILGDESAGLIKDVADNTSKFDEIEELVSSISDAATSAVQTVSVLGMTEEDEAVTKEGTNVEINKIPVSILVSDLTLILNCGNATEVI